MVLILIVERDARMMCGVFVYFFLCLVFTVMFVVFSYTFFVFGVLPLVCGVFVYFFYVWCFTVSFIVGL